MFHFWFNTFFVSVDHEERTVTLKSPSDGRGRTPRSSTAASSTVKLPSTAPPVRPVQTTGRRQSGDDLLARTDIRTVDRVKKPLAVRTSSSTSSTSSGTHSTVSVRRSSQQRDSASVRPRSVHVSSTLSGSEAATNLSGSTNGLNSPTNKMLRDKLKASPGSAGTTQRSTPLSRQEPANSARPVAARTNGHLETSSREEQKIPGGESSTSSARQGNPRSIRGVGLHHSVARCNSAGLSHTREDEATKTPERNGILRPGTSNDGGRKPMRETNPSTKPPMVTGGMTKASSTTALNKTAKKDSATGNYVQNPTTSAKASSSAPRYVQNYSASRRVLTPDKSRTLHQTAVTKQAPDRQPLKSSVSGSRLVNPAMKARAEELPSDPVSLTRFTPRTSRQSTSAAQPSSAVFDVSSASSQPTTFCTLTLPKSEIDKASKDVQQKVYSSDFKVLNRFVHTFCCLRIQIV